MPEPSPTPHPVLTTEQATNRAKQALADLHSKHDLVLLEDQTQKKDFGWVFAYSTSKYLASHDAKDLVPGIGPFVVERETGEVSFLSTSGPPRAVVAAWEKQWHEKHGDKRPEN